MRIERPEDVGPALELAFSDKHKARLGVHGGKLNIRVYAGVLKKRVTPCTTPHPQDGTRGRIAQIQADQHTDDIDAVYSGDIAAIVGLRNVTTGDTITSPRAPGRGVRRAHHHESPDCQRGGQRVSRPLKPGTRPLQDVDGLPMARAVGVTAACSGSLDANVVLRLLLNDIPDQHAAAVTGQRARAPFVVPGLIVEVIFYYECPAGPPPPRRARV